MAELFAAIAGLSPWWWVAFGIGLGVVEMLTMSFFLIGPALAAILTAGVVALAPAMRGEFRVTIFAIIAVVLTLLARSWMARRGDHHAATSLNNRAARVVGRTAKVLDCADGEGAVEIDGMRWHAVWMGGKVSEPGTSVRILRADGMTLRVEPSDNASV